MDSYIVGKLVGAALGAGLVTFFIARKAGGVVPYFAAAGAAVAGIGGMFAVEAIAGSLGTSDADVKKLEAGFNEGCIPSCTKAGAAEPVCRKICSCVLTGLHARHPSNEEFGKWFRASNTSMDSVKQEVTEISTSCGQAAGAATP